LTKELVVALNVTEQLKKMVTKKQINTTPKVVLECIESLKEAHGSPNFLEKTERGKIIIIKFKNKVKFEFPMNQEEYFQYKELERGLWK
jgi:hypothetical protein